MDAHGASIGGVEPADALLELWKCLQWEELLTKLGRPKGHVSNFPDCHVQLPRFRLLPCLHRRSTPPFPRGRIWDPLH